MDKTGGRGGGVCCKSLKARNGVYSITEHSPKSLSSSVVEKTARGASLPGFLFQPYHSPAASKAQSHNALCIVISYFPGHPPVRKMTQRSSAAVPTPTLGQHLSTSQQTFTQGWVFSVIMAKGPGKRGPDLSLVKHRAQCNLLSACRKLQLMFVHTRNSLLLASASSTPLSHAYLFM